MASSAGHAVCGGRPGRQQAGARGGRADGAGHGLAATGVMVDRLDAAPGQTEIASERRRRMSVLDWPKNRSAGPLRRNGAAGCAGRARGSGYADG